MSKVFYPDANPESTSVDGSALSAPNSVWATVRGASASNTASSSGTTLAIEAYKSGSVYYIDRTFLLFDTSSIPNSATITAATLALYKNATAISNDDSSSACLVSSSPATNTDIITDDYDQVGTTRFANDVTYASMSINNWFTFTLNATGLAAISKTGVTKFAVRDKRDLDNTAPTGINSIICNSADAGSNKPTLTVTYSGGQSLFFSQL